MSSFEAFTSAHHIKFQDHTTLVWYQPVPVSTQHPELRTYYLLSFPWETLHSGTISSLSVRQLAVDHFFLKVFHYLAREAVYLAVLGWELLHFCPCRCQEPIMRIMLCRCVGFLLYFGVSIDFIEIVRGVGPHEDTLWAFNTFKILHFSSDCRLFHLQPSTWLQGCLTELCYLSWKWKVKPNEYVPFF